MSKESFTTISRYEQMTLQLVYFGSSLSFTYPAMIIASTKDAYWAPFVAWAVFGILSAWIYSRLLAGTRGKGLLESLIQAMGMVPTLVIAAPVIIFIAVSLIISVRTYAEIITMTMLPSTPIPFLTGMLIPSIALAYTGILSIVRAARALFLISSAIIFLLMCVGFSDTSWITGGPWLRISGDFFARKEFYAASFAWMGYIFTSLIGTYTPQAAKSFFQTYVISVLIAILLCAGYIYLPLVTFGPEMSKHLELPFISKMDSIYHYWIIFENLTAFFVSVAMFYLLVVLSLKMRALGEAVKSLFPRWGVLWIYGCFFVLLYAGSNLIPSWEVLKDSYYWSSGLRIYTMFGFPLLALAGYKLGMKVKRKEASA